MINCLDKELGNFFFLNSKNSREIANLYSGDAFGEIGLIYNDVRTAMDVSLE